MEKLILENFESVDKLNAAKVQMYESKFKEISTVIDKTVEKGYESFITPDDLSELSKLSNSIKQD